MAKKSNVQNASGSGQGYLYQFLMALCVSLERSKTDIDSFLNIENFDDISFTDVNDDPLELIQSKHHSFPKNLTDGSEDLWKTLSIWIERDKEYLKQDIELSFVLVTNGTVGQKSICEYLKADKALRSVDHADAILEDKAKNLSSSSTEPYRNTFLSYSKRKRKSLLERVVIVDSSPSIGDIENFIKSEYLFTVQDNHKDLLLERFIGWWLKKVIFLLQDTSKSIEIKTIMLKLKDLSYQFHNENLPIDFLDSEPDWDVGWDDRIFVHQVRMITERETRIKNAIRDYHRAFEQRSRWAREDLLIDEDIENYEKKLFDEWERYRDRILDLRSPNDDDSKKRVGVEIYNWVEGEANFPIRTHVKEPYVMRGSYHMLSDEQKVGWHPDFIARLKVILEAE